MGHALREPLHLPPHAAQLLPRRHGVLARAAALAAQPRVVGLGRREAAGRETSTATTTICFYIICDVLLLLLLIISTYC